MADPTWFRGEITGGAVAKPGGAVLHDFFDGMYLTDDPSLAKEYMDLRLYDEGLPKDKGRVVAASFDPYKLGRVLDLRTDPRWAEFLKRPDAAMIMNVIHFQQNYHTVFKNFVAEYKISSSDYAFVIGPEYVRRAQSSSVQICVVHPDGAPSDLSKQIRDSLRPVAVSSAGTPPSGTPPPPPPASPAKGGAPPPAGAGAKGAPAVKSLGPDAVAKATTAPAAPPKPSGVTGVKLPGGGVADWSRSAPLPPIGGGPNSVVGKVMKNQDAAAAIGVALGAGIQALGDVGIRWAIEEDLRTKERAYIEGALRRGAGVLIIIRMEQWKHPDNNGMRARGLVSVETCSGATQEEALKTWRTMPKLLKGGAPSWEMMPEQYAWIPPPAP